VTALCVVDGSERGAIKCFFCSCEMNWSLWSIKTGGVPRGWSSNTQFPGLKKNVAGYHPCGFNSTRGTED
jgi:hypothetical protein